MSGTSPSRDSRWGVGGCVSGPEVDLPADRGIHHLVAEHVIARPHFALEQSDTGWAKFDLTLFPEAGPDGLTGYVEYDTTRYHHDLATALAEGFAAVLAAACRDPGTAVAALPISRRTAAQSEPALLNLSVRPLARLAAHWTEATP